MQLTPVPVDFDVAAYDGSLPESKQYFFVDNKSSLIINCCCC